MPKGNVPVAAVIKGSGKHPARVEKIGREINGLREMLFRLFMATEPDVHASQQLQRRNVCRMDIQPFPQEGLRAGQLIGRASGSAFQNLQSCSSEIAPGGP